MVSALEARRSERSASGSTGFITCSSNLPDKIAIALDAQMDDGDARSGTLRAQLQTAGPSPNVSTAADAANYVENGVNLYTVCRAM